MRIRGTKNPCCELCAYCSILTPNNKFYCDIKKKETPSIELCPKFKYDIFKYKPAVKADFSKFSKEDFEI